MSVLCTNKCTIKCIKRIHLCLELHGRLLNMAQKVTPVAIQEGLTVLYCYYFKSDYPGWY